MGVEGSGTHGCVLSVRQAALKKYQTEQRSKGDALDKCQAELKKLRKKSQGSKNPQKYSDKELQVGPGPRPRGRAEPGGPLPLHKGPPTAPSWPGWAPSRALGRARALS